MHDDIVYCIVIGSAVFYIFLCVNMMHVAPWSATQISYIEVDDLLHCWVGDCGPEHKPYAYRVRFQVETKQRTQMAEQTANKGSLMCASKVAPPSGHS